MGSGANVTVVGFCFDGNSVGQVNGANRGTSLVDNHNLVVALTQADLASAGTLDISVLDLDINKRSNVLHLQVT